MAQNYLRMVGSKRVEHLHSAEKDLRRFIVATDTPMQ
jgi:hypothetical protein